MQKKKHTKYISKTSKNKFEFETRNYRIKLTLWISFKNDEFHWKKEHIYTKKEKALWTSVRRNIDDNVTPWKYIN